MNRYFAFLTFVGIFAVCLSVAVALSDCAERESAGETFCSTMRLCDKSTVRTKADSSGDDLTFVTTCKRAK